MALIKSILFLLLFSLWGWAHVRGQDQKPQVKDYMVNSEDQTFWVKWRTDLESPKYFRMRGKSIVVFDDIRIFMLHFEGTQYVSHVAALHESTPFKNKDTLFNTYKPESDRVIIYRPGFKYKLGNLTLDKFRIVKYPPEEKPESSRAKLAVSPDSCEYIIKDYHLLKVTSDREARKFYSKGDNSVQVFDYAGVDSGWAYDLLYRHLPHEVRQVEVFITSEFVNEDSIKAVADSMKRLPEEGKRAVWIHLWPDGSAGVKVE
ncbi:MAG: hypothetical protein AAFV78_01890 [Bacteroidota bacterium]